MKSFMPDAKLIWIDAKLDAKTPESGQDANSMPLAFLSGHVQNYKNWHCLDMSKDLCFVGTRSYKAEEARLISDQYVLVIQPEDCQTHDIRDIQIHINRHFGGASRYWISLDVDSLDATQFKSTDI